jgi:hypothetical protein
MTHNYQYTDIREDQIRLLTLLPAFSIDDPLECNLDVYNRDSAPSYEAVSYVWGDEDGNYTQLRVLPSSDQEIPGNKSFFIRPNLVSALKSRSINSLSDKCLCVDWRTGFRNHKNPRILWTDAVCINQDSSAEKSQQVPMMEKTYSQATNVLVWLGNPTETSQVAFAFMREMISPASSVDNLVTGNGDQWAALESLMRMPWFTRRWIVQEIALAKTASIYCGREEISWAEFCEAVSLFSEYYSDIKKTFLDEKYGYSRNRLGEVHALGACQLIGITNEVFRKAADGSVQTRLMSLENLVARLTMFDARDPRDTIYAMVALAKDIRTVAQKHHTTEVGAFPVETPNMEKQFDLSSPDKRRKTRSAGAVWQRAIHGVIAGQNETYGSPAHSGGKRKRNIASVRDVVNQAMPPKPKFRVDYKQSLLRVCMDFVAFTILQSGSVDIICRPWVPESVKEKFNLPSWLIDVEANSFRPKEDGTFVRVNGNPLVGHGTNQHKWYTACGPLSRALRLTDKNVDNGWGFGYFDRASAFEDGKGHHKSLFVNGFILDTIAEIKTNAADGTIPSEWFDFGGWKSRSTLPPDDFWRTLVADRDGNGQAAKVYYPRTLRDVVQKHCARGSPMNVKMILATPQSGRTAEEVLNRVLEVAPNRRMFRTSSDTERKLGLGPAKAEKGDLICILAGCSVPVVLRRQEEVLGKRTCVYYTLQGDAYVHGFMDGDAVREQERRKIDQQQFELR